MELLAQAGRQHHPAIGGYRDPVVFHGSPSLDATELYHGRSRIEW